LVPSNGTIESPGICGNLIPTKSYSYNAAPTEVPNQVLPEEKTSSQVPSLEDNLYSLRQTLGYEDPIEPGPLTGTNISISESITQTIRTMALTNPGMRPLVTIDVKKKN
jgi:hypothetical protein